MRSILQLKAFDSVTNNEDPIVAILWNIRTISENKIRKIIEIMNFLTTKKVRMDDDMKKTKDKRVEIDFLVVTEFGKKESKYNPYNIPGYKLFTALRIDKKGGGVGIYVKNSHTAHIKYIEVANDYEFLLIEIWQDTGTRIDVLGVYRPPIGNKQIFF